MNKINPDLEAGQRISPASAKVDGGVIIFYKVIGPQRLSNQSNETQTMSIADSLVFKSAKKNMPEGLQERLKTSNASSNTRLYPFRLSLPEILQFYKYTIAR